MEATVPIDAPGAAGKRTAGDRPAPSRQRLLRAGLAIARRSGLRAVTVRGAAQRAGVNLGSFVYHFGSREAFVAELLELWYAPLLARMQLAVDARRPPLARLRAMLLQFADWAVANSSFISHVVMDAAAGEVAARRFVASLERRHPALLLEAIRAAQRAGELRRDNPIKLLLFLMSTLTLPAVLLQGAGVGRLFSGEIARALVPLATGRAALQQRLSWALRGLAP